MLHVLLRARIALIGGLAIPGHGLRVVLRDTPAFLVKPADVVLRDRIALIGGLAIPGHGLRVVLCCIGFVALLERVSDQKINSARFCLGFLICWLGSDSGDGQ